MSEIKIINHVLTAPEDRFLFTFFGMTAQVRSRLIPGWFERYYMVNTRLVQVV